MKDYVEGTLQDILLKQDGTPVLITKEAAVTGNITDEF